VKRTLRHAIMVMAAPTGRADTSKRSFRSTVLLHQPSERLRDALDALQVAPVSSDDPLRFDFGQFIPIAERSDAMRHHAGIDAVCTILAAAFAGDAQCVGEVIELPASTATSPAEPPRELLTERQSVSRVRRFIHMGAGCLRSRTALLRS